MMKKNLLLLLVLSFLLALTACSNNASYTDIDNAAAKRLIDDNKVEVIDVRTPEEYAGSHIPEASLIPLQELEARISELNKDKSYLLVCRSGNRSSQAAQILINNGFTSVYNLKTGMNEWPYEVVK